MATANDLITRGMKAIGCLGRTEVPTAADANDGLVAFNALLDSWSNENLMSFVTQQRSFTLVANQQSYTIGVGGNINTQRPIDITQAFCRDTNGLDYPLDIWTQDRWNTIGLKSVQSQIPQVLFYDPGFTLGTINIYPVPMLPYTVFYDSVTQQVQFSSLTQSLSMPPGYERVFVSHLALELMANGFPCLLNPLQLKALTTAASDGMANIKRTNIKEIISTYDESLVSHAQSTYNPYRDAQ